MPVLVDVVDATGVEGGGTTDDAVNLVTFLEEQLGQVRTVLTGYAGHERALHFHGIIAHMRRLLLM